jgi:hypothetical protein
VLILCPKCSFAGSTLEPTGLRKCLSCGNAWRAALAYPEAPAFSGPVPQAATAKPAVIVIFAVIALSAVGAVAYFALGARSAAPSLDHANYNVVAEHPEFFTPEASPTAPANYRVSAEIGGRCEGGNAGSRWFLHEYRNTGKGPISFPTILVRPRDADGASMQDMKSVSNVYSLPAGESCWLLTTLPRNAVSAAFIIDTPERVSQHTPTVSRLQPGEFTKLPSAAGGGYTDLSGSVKNVHSRSVSSVLVQLIGFDAGDKPCSYTLVYAADKIVEPGASTSFKVTAGSWQVSVPERWEVHAWGVVEK